MRNQKSQGHRDLQGHARFALLGEGLIHCREMLSFVLPQTSRSNYFRKGIRLTKDLTGKILESRASKSSTKGLFVKSITVHVFVSLFSYNFHFMP